MSDLMAERVEALPDDVRERFYAAAEEYKAECCENTSEYLLELLAWAYATGRLRR